MDTRVRRAVKLLTTRLKEIEKRLEPLLREQAELQAGLASIEPKPTKREENGKALAILGIEAGRWKDMSISESMQELLSNRGPVPLDSVLEALKRGEAKIGDKPERWVANVKAAIATARRAGQLRFRYDEKNDTVELRLKRSRPPVEGHQSAAAATDTIATGTPGI